VASDSAFAAYSLAASRLWAGQPPRLLPALRARSLLTLNPTTIGIFAVAALSTVSPPATRSVLARIIAVRDHLASLKVGCEPFEWHFA
jgi:hypothetical protein